MFFKSKKQKKLKEDIYNDDFEINIYSGKVFVEEFVNIIRNKIAVMDVEVILSIEDKERIPYILRTLEQNAEAAFVESLIKTGYKKEKKNLWKVLS